ncbi:hypothetical protein Tco_0167844 [Tanacetum coccineum]
MSESEKERNLGNNDMDEGENVGDGGGNEGGNENDLSYTGQSQQGVSNDVLNHKLIADIENDIMDPVMQCTTLPSHSGFSTGKTCLICHGDTPRYLMISHSEIIDMNMWNAAQASEILTYYIEI